MPATLRTGLVSVTFRQRTIAQIVDDVAAAGLDGIEWGGDVHVPPNDPAKVADARHRTADAGLVVTAYGSYYNATKDKPDLAAAVLDTAAALGAPTVRIWAGPVGSAQADEATFARVAADVARVCDLAKPLGLSITLEYHGGTLTDTLDGTLHLLTAVDRPNLVSGWQPRDGLTAADGVAEISRLGKHLGNVHVFHWWPTGATRHPLADGVDRWTPYLTAAAADGRPRFALLEFVKDDDVDQFKRDAATLTGMLATI